MIDDKRIRLLDAALQCFTTHGFHGTSTADVSTQAKVATGTMFRHFATKDALVHATRDAARDTLQCAIRDLPAPAMRPGEGLRPFLERRWSAAVAAAQTQPDAFRFWCLARATPGYAQSPDAEWPIRGLFGSLAEWLGRANGSYIPDHLGAALWEAIWATAVRFELDHALRNGPDPDPKPAITRAFEAWWTGSKLDPNGWVPTGF